MTYPAELTYWRDADLTPSQRRVFDYLRTVLDFSEVRAVKLQVHCEELGMDRADFGRAIDALVERGYLIEHPRDVHQVRRFTLAWSINPERQGGSKSPG